MASDKSLQISGFIFKFIPLQMLKSKQYWGQYFATLRNGMQASVEELQRGGYVRFLLRRNVG
jgi:isocitrate lyase